jgi:predicted P-loop ATPase
VEKTVPMQPCNAASLAAPEQRSPSPPVQPAIPVNPLPDTANVAVAQAPQLNVDESAQVAPLAVLAGEPIEALPRLDPAGFPHAPQGWQRVLPSTLPNVAHLLRSYGIGVRYDTVKKKLRIAIPGHTGTTDNADNTAMTIILSLAALHGMALGQIPAIVEAIGDRHLYNPVADWISSKAWDGRDRLIDLCDTLTARDGFCPHLKRTLIHRWLLSAVAAALMPRGFKARGVLTFQGPQGIGKTSWVMALVSDPGLREMVIKIDHHLDPHNKDSILGAITHWIVEIGELDSSFRKSDVSRLKGVLTSDSDRVRRPYARTESEYQRRTVFCATVNEENFLVDHTGNTRWWTLPLVSINYKHNIDMQQVFAQLAHDFRRGEQWWLTADEEALLEQHNSDHRSVSLMRERLMQRLDMSLVGQPGNPAMGTMEVLVELRYERPSNGDTKELTALLRELLGPSKKVNGTQKWRIPLRPNTKSSRAHEEVDHDRY